MKQEVKSLEDKVLKDISLDKAIFGLEPKESIIHRMINYQLAKKRSGNHKTKGISEISGTTKKPFKQKGTGSARQGSRRSPQMRGGAVIFGPQVRSHAHKLPKKIKSLALKMALSSKLKDGKLKIVDDFKLSKPKTSILKDKLSKLKIESALLIGGDKVEKNFSYAVRNVPKIDFLPAIGINVYDIIKRDLLVLSVDAVNALNERFRKWQLFLMKEHLRL